MLVTLVDRDSAGFPTAAEGGTCAGVDLVMPLFFLRLHNKILMDM